MQNVRDSHEALLCTVMFLAVSAFYKVQLRCFAKSKPTKYSNSIPFKELLFYVAYNLHYHLKKAEVNYSYRMPVVGLQFNKSSRFVKGILWRKVPRKEVLSISEGEPVI